MQKVLSQDKEDTLFALVVEAASLERSKPRWKMTLSNRLQVALP